MYKKKQNPSSKYRQTTGKSLAKRRQIAKPYNNPTNMLSLNDFLRSKEARIARQIVEELTKM